MSGPTAPLPALMALSAVFVVVGLLGAAMSFALLVGEVVWR